MLGYGLLILELILILVNESILLLI